jgi:hypothetical protein
MYESLKRAQKRYMEKKKAIGWLHIRFFIPSEVKKELMEAKAKIMKKYWSDNGSK